MTDLQPAVTDHRDTRRPLELQGDARQEIVAVERALLEAIYAADKATMRRMMLPDGLGVDQSFGYATQASLIDGIHQLSTVRWKLAEPRVLAVGDQGRIITYRLTQEISFKGRAEPTDVYSTTVWSRIENRWMAIFHQETPAIHK